MTNPSFGNESKKRKKERVPSGPGEAASFGLTEENVRQHTMKLSNNKKHQLSHQEKIQKFFSDEWMAEATKGVNASGKQSAGDFPRQSRGLDLARAR
jgi:hypothetical protein